MLGDPRVVILDDTRDKISCNPEGSWVVVSPFDGDPHSTDISWMNRALRDLCDCGIRLPLSMSDRSSKFSASESLMRSAYPSDFVACAADSSSASAAAAAADSFVRSIL